ncbi:unnamed protein product [Musa acuminata subsp. malaccensis]|nr:unnamed protein product [Musa acuminata subsp. malaccensis]
MVIHESSTLLMWKRSYLKKEKTRLHWVDATRSCASSLLTRQPYPPEMIASPANADGFRRWHEAGNDDHIPPADVRIVTSDGQSIAAHSSLLGSASPVLERLLYRPRKTWNSDRIIHILGVPQDAVLAFVRFLHSSSRTVLTSREAEEAMGRHGVALLALSHAYRVPWLKRGCEAAAAARVSAENVMDVLKLARMCDALWLRQRCMRQVAKDFAAVQQTEGWRFVQKHDPALELEILQFLEEADQRKKRWRRERANQEMYQILGEAMDCLQHTFAGGCADEASSGKKSPCKSPLTCQRLQHLLRHYATCDNKLVPKCCPHCTRMRRLCRLHSSLCDQTASCKVPLCKQFKLKAERDQGEEKTWGLLVKKVATARTMASLANRERSELVQRSRTRYRGAR